MNQEKAAKLLPIITAFAQGSELQFFSPASKMWINIDNPDFSADISNYRIKPPPIVKYRRYVLEETSYCTSMYTSALRHVHVLSYTPNASSSIKYIENLSNFCNWIDYDWVTE